VAIARDSFGTNHLDNPVLWKVARTLKQYGFVGGAIALVVGVVIGVWIRRRSARGRGGAATA
jgi:ABC-type nitrate/sulfonate/bicarbonate transport system permease component